MFEITCFLEFIDIIDACNLSYLSLLQPSVSSMPRLKPTSGKAKKEALQAQRAAKASTSTNSTFSRGTESDARYATTAMAPATAQSTLSAPMKLQSIPSKHTPRRPGVSYAEQKELDSKRAAASALESRFIKLPREYVEHYKEVVSKEVFQRPIPPEKGCLSTAELREEEGRGVLKCPKRPKWKYWMSKKQVERNEEVMFEKWIQETDEAMRLAEQKHDFTVMG